MCIRDRDDIAWFRDYRFPKESSLLGPVKMSVTMVNAGTCLLYTSTAEKIYEQIDKDLTEAEECLPLRWDSDYTGRLTWGAARSLHARTYICLLYTSNQTVTTLPIS